MAETKCFRCRVPTTNSTGNTFRMGEEYFACYGGIVFVLATDVQHAARQVPTAISIESVGAALKETSTDGR